MTFYLDTSVMVSALSQEPDSDRVRLWLADRLPETLIVSDWLELEVSSAFAIKCRMGVFNQSQREEGLAAFARLASRTLTVVPIEHTHFRAATRLVDRSIDGLRAGDALHLAVALEHATTLCTLDKGFARAALTVGIKVEVFEDVDLRA